MNQLRRFLIHPWTLIALRLAIGGIFIYAGMVKIGEAQAFADGIAAFRLLPAPLVPLLAAGLPPFEVLAGILLLVGFQRRSAAFSLLVLSVVFTVALGSALARGLKVDCGCFGHGNPSVVGEILSIGRDVLLCFGLTLLYRAWAGSATPLSVPRPRPVHSPV